jgi:ribosomal protein S10
MSAKKRVVKKIEVLTDVINTSEDQMSDILASFERIDLIVVCKSLGKMSFKPKEPTEDLMAKVIRYSNSTRKTKKHYQIARFKRSIQVAKGGAATLKREIQHAHAKLKLLITEYEAPTETKISVKPTETDADIDCPVCFDAVKHQYAVTFGCHHQVCSNCTYELIQKKSECPLCRSSITGVTCHSKCIQASLQQLL